MTFITRPFSNQQHIIKRKSVNLKLIILITLLSFLLSACGGSSTTASIVNNTPVVAPVSVEPQITLSGKTYNVIDIGLEKDISIQAYWPANREIPVAFIDTLQITLPTVHDIFLQNHFAFSTSEISLLQHNYKRILFNPLANENTLGLVETQIDYQLIGGDLQVSFLANETPESNDLLQPLVALTYRSERLKYQTNESDFENIVSLGLALHFIEKAMAPAVLFTSKDFPNEQNKLTALAEVKSSMIDDIALNNEFIDKYAAAVGYYLVQEHFQHYLGSSAINSFSVDNTLFIPWLAGEDNTVKKTSSFVRTGDVDDQIAVNELTRQASQFVGAYFLEGHNKEKLIALTFDDGPSKYSEQIMDVLEASKIPASFFWQGKNLANFKSTVERAMSAGHTVANHSWNHTNGMAYSAEELWQQQVLKTNNEFQLSFNITPRFYRPPYGEISDDQVTFLKDKGMKVLLWSVDSRDWNADINTVSYIESEIINHQHEEVITLMHDAGGNRQNTVDSLATIIKHYHEQGYQFVNLETLLGISDKQ